MITKQEALQRIEELKQYVGGLDKHIFQTGDVAICSSIGIVRGHDIRIIVPEEGELVSRDAKNLRKCAVGQKEFEYFNYAYAGKISDYVNKETVENFLEKQKC